MSTSPVGFAPVLVTVYTRLNHFEQSIRALSKCQLADQTDLYVASDAATSLALDADVSAVRNYARTISGFKSVTLIERECNYGVIGNYEDSVDFVLNKHGKLIFLQDDVVVGFGFLKFINDGLVRFEDEPNVISVCGYIPPCAEGVADGPFFLRRRSPYGFGMWKGKEAYFDKIAGKAVASKVLSSYKIFKAIARESPHIMRALPFIARGDFRAGDFEAAAAMQLYNIFALYPPLSLVKNIGLDGSGENSGFDAILQNQTYSDEVIQMSHAIEVVVCEDVAKIISEYWNSKGAWIFNASIFIGWNYIPGFYFVLRALKRVRVVYMRAASNLKCNTV